MDALRGAGRLRARAETPPGAAPALGVPTPDPRLPRLLPAHTASSHLRNRLGVPTSPLTETGVGGGLWCLPHLPADTPAQLLLLRKLLLKCSISETPMGPSRIQITSLSEETSLLGLHSCLLASSGFCSNPHPGPACFPEGTACGSGAEQAPPSSASLQGAGLLGTTLNQGFAAPSSCLGIWAQECPFASVCPLADGTAAGALWLGCQAGSDPGASGPLAEHRWSGVYTRSRVKVEL